MGRFTSGVVGAGTAFRGRSLIRGWVLAGLVGVGFWASYTADASMGFFPPPTLYESTVESDLWVRARVVSSRMTEPSEYDSARGNIYHMDVTLEILDSTAPGLPATIDAVITGATSHWKVGDGERFLALTRKNGAFVQEWAPAHKIREDGRVNLRRLIDEAAASDTFVWSLLRDTRLLVDGDGEVAPAVRTHWEGVISDGGPVEVQLALEWFSQLRVPDTDGLALAKNVTRHYTELAERVAENPGVDYKNHGFVLCWLFPAVVAEIARLQHVEAARLLEDLYWKDQGSHHFLDGVGIAPLLAVPATGAQLSHLTAMLGNSVSLSGYDLNILARIPDKPVEDLLWSINSAPEEFGLRHASSLVPLWEGLTRRSDPRIRDYLNTVIHLQGFSNRGFADREFASGIEEEVFRTYTQLPRVAEAHEADKRWLANESAAGNTTSQSLLAHVLRSQDRHLAPVLARDQALFQYREEYFVEKIILRIPDPAFVPLLESWESADPPSDLIQAFLACGEVEHATKLAMAYMAKPVSEASPAFLAKLVQDRGELILAFAEAGHTDLALSWIESVLSLENLRRYDRLLIAGVAAEDQGEALYNLHRASLDVALLYPTLGGQRAIPWLEWYRDVDESLEGFASLGLMLTKEEEEEISLDKFQAYIESSTPFMAAVPFLLRMNHPVVRALVLHYFEQDLKDFDRWVEDPADYRRLGMPFLKLLLDALESGNVRRRSEAMDACAAVLGRKFDYRLAQPRVYNDVAVADCVEAMRMLTKDWARFVAP